MNRSAGRAPIMNCPLTAGTTFAANDDRENCRRSVEPTFHLSVRPEQGYGICVATSTGAYG
jgi:hypothetical protein